MRKQVLFLVLWSFLLVTPKLATTGIEIVTQTYREGAVRFWGGGNPYASPQLGDWFLYSPFFAMAYGALAHLPSKPQALLWALLNTVVFWTGVSSWFRFHRESSWVSWLALIGCSMELDGSLRYQQINPLLTGMILLGLAAYRDGNLTKAGWLLALGCNIKLLPAAFAGPLLVPLRKRYLFSLVGFSIFLILLPALAVGIRANLLLHWRQWLSLSGDLSQRKLLDIATVSWRLGWPLLGKVFWGIVASATAGLMIGMRVSFQRGPFPWGLWISIGLSSLLLLSPRTESPTFVLLGPVYLFLAGEKGWLGRGATLISIFFVSVIYNSIWPSFLKLPIQEFWASKALGTLLLWAVTVFISLRWFWLHRSHRFQRIQVNV